MIAALPVSLILEVTLAALLCATLICCLRLDRRLRDLRNDQESLSGTVRALMVHSARWTTTMERQFANVDERFQLCGYGVSDEAFATGCTADRATVIFEPDVLEF